ncbi:MAG: PHP domain-containing protein [Pseudomonadota bacterium]
MVKFTRNKLVSVYREGPELLVAHGILEDDIYGLEVDVTLGLSDLEIKAIQGRWKRAENSECIRGLPLLQEAVGFHMGEGFIAQVQKIIGRKVCRHFADILLEACYAAREAALLIQGETGKIANPAGDFEAVHHEDPGKSASSPVKPVISVKNETPGPKPPGTLSKKKKETAGMVIDLHVHSFPASPCSSVSVEALIEEAQKIGLDGFCLTDHNYVWDPRVVADLRQKTGFLVLRGNEITTDQGDMVVFGLDKDIRGIIKLAELREEVSRVKGFIIVAHPFRGFLTFGLRKLGLTAEKALERPLWKWVDAVEVMNSKVTEKENALAAQVAAGLNRPSTGGSDAHTASALGIYATRFSRAIQDEKGLIEALKGGDYSPVAFRKEIRKGGAVHGRIS